MTKTTEHSLETPVTELSIPAVENPDLELIAAELQAYIDQLNTALMVDIPAHIRESNRAYRDMISLASELNTRLSTSK